jgi:membrane peptidoglycan carboxypeptidase
MGFLLHLELRNHPPAGEWRLPKAFRRVSVAAASLALLILASLVAIGFADARRASRISDARIDAIRRSPTCVSLRHIPAAMSECVIANEDCFFHMHHGYGPVDMHRALRVNIRAGRVKQGGSTITQQLAKNLFFTNDRTVRRKVAELIVATRLERGLSKNDILELYLNTIDFGLGARGIGPAARIYFGKDASDLTDAECALLAGLVSKPPADELTPARARAALRLTMGRLENINSYRRTSIQHELDGMGENRWLTEHLDKSLAAIPQGT